MRDDRRFRQGLRLRRLPHHKTLDEYDFSFAALLGPTGVGRIGVRKLSNSQVRYARGDVMVWAA